MILKDKKEYFTSKEEVQKKLLQELEKVENSRGKGKKIYFFDIGNFVNLVWDSAGIAKDFHKKQF